MSFRPYTSLLVLIMTHANIAAYKLEIAFDHRLSLYFAVFHCFGKGTVCGAFAV